MSLQGFLFVIIVLLQCALEKDSGVISINLWNSEFSFPFLIWLPNRITHYLIHTRGNEE